MKKHNISKKILFIIFTLQALLAFSGQAVHSTESFQHHIWTIDDGLPMNSVNAITQAPDGYLWVGTEAGLARFDGITFEVFNHENTPVFSNDIITSLEVDRSGALWIGTRGDGLIRYKNKSFKTITGNPRLLAAEVWCIMESMDGSIWIGSSAGLCRFANNSFSGIPLPGKLANRKVKALLEDRNGNIWTGAEDGLMLIKKRNDQFLVESMDLDEVEILTLFEDRKGAIWIGTNEKGLYRYWEDRLDLFNEKDGLTNSS
ncbi:MAG TPA: two-component regulator propeller domain-containing protein, partial [Candidatus Deferrimicrobium sp.]|nr:two-component regulator propeller domain-containing protein [Candidatus Deferrimicrobium sp.]